MSSAPRNWINARHTGWISARTPPLASRPGRYQVQYGGERGLIRVELWDGQRWVGGCPNAQFGDRWRGLMSPA